MDNANATNEDSGAMPDGPPSDGALALAMVEASPDALVMADERGVIELVNSQTEALFGYDRAEILGRPVEMLLPERFTHIHRAHRTRYRAGPEVRTMGSGMDLWASHADGSEIPVEVSLSPLHVGGKLRILAAIRDISERVAAEARSNLIQTTIDATHDGVFMFSPDEQMLFTYVNRGAVEQLGYSQDELLTMSPLHIKPDFTRAQFLETIAPLVSGTIPRTTFKTRHRRKDGTDVPVEIILEYPQTGSPTAGRVMVALVRDITDRVESERLLEASRARFRAAFDSGPVPMSIIERKNGAEPVVIEANAAFADLLGYGHQEVIGMRYSQLRHQDDQDGESADSLDQPGHPVDRRYIRADGSLVWVRLHSAGLGVEGDKVTAIGHLVDISAEVRAAAARSRRDLLAAALSEIRWNMLRGASRGDALDLVCARSKETLDAAAVLIVTPTDDGDELAIESAVGMTDDARSALVFQTGQGVASEVFATGTPQLTQLSDPRMSTTNRKIMEQVKADSIMVAPLHGADGVVGVIVVARALGADPLDDTDLAAVEQFASAAVAAVELAAVRDAQALLELLDDRERIGRDMHDKVIGRLFATGMSMQATVSRISDSLARERMVTAVDEIDEAITEIRTAVFGLRAGADWGRGVKGEILALAADQSDVLGFEPTVLFQGPVDAISSEVMGELRAAMREAFTNIAKYANATKVRVHVTADRTQLVAEIADNGVGFTPLGTSGDHNTAELGGKGLRNIAARAEALGGTAVVTSAPGEGTVVKWTARLD